MRVLEKAGRVPETQLICQDVPTKWNKWCLCLYLSSMLAKLAVETSCTQVILTMTVSPHFVQRLCPSNKSKSNAIKQILVTDIMISSARCAADFSLRPHLTGQASSFSPAGARCELLSPAGAIGGLCQRHAKLIVGYLYAHWYVNKCHKRLRHHVLHWLCRPESQVRCVPLSSSFVLVLLVLFFAHEVGGDKAVRAGQDVQMFRRAWRLEAVWSSASNSDPMWLGIFIAEPGWSFRWGRYPH